MKTPVKGVCLLVLVAVFVAEIANSQEKSPTARFLLKKGYTFPDSTMADSARLKRSLKWPDTMFYNTAYRAKLLGSPMISFSFTRTVLINGKFQVLPTMSIGGGYTWFIGTFYFNENDKITVDPVIFFGLMGDIGVQNDFSLNKLASFFAGGFIGVGPITLFTGYDFILRSPSVGLGARIDLYTLAQMTLKPFGKVHEVRKHKRVAIPIANE